MISVRLQSNSTATKITTKIASEIACVNRPLRCPVCAIRKIKFRCTNKNFNPRRNLCNAHGKISIKQNDFQHTTTSLRIPSKISLNTQQDIHQQRAKFHVKHDASCDSKSNTALHYRVEIGYCVARGICSEL